MKMKSYFDMLSAANHKISDTDQLLAVLNGLSDEYESIIAIICSREVPYSLHHVTSLLLSHEGRILQRNSSDIVANYSNYSNYSKRGSNSNQTQGGRGLNTRGRCRGGRNYYNNSRPQCQLCGKIGHTVLKCYYRFDQNFHGSGMINGANSSGHQNSQRSNANLAHTQSEFPLENAPLEAMLTCAEGKNDDSWYPDSGATNHITKDYNNVTYGTDFHGSQKVHMGNGTCLDIKHIGNSFVSSNVPSRSLTLKNILHVPLITKNLVSVSQFTKDNNVYFEFHPSTCFVKDQVTKTPLLQGALHKGLYRLNFSNKAREVPGQISHVHVSETKDPTDISQASPQNLVSSSKESLFFDIWHKRLGHPSSKIVTKVLSDCNIPFQMNKMPPFFCVSCQMGKSHKLPFRSSHTSYTSPLQLVESDLWGPSPVLSTIGFKFYITFVDVYSRYTWIYFLKRKSEAFESCLHFKTQAENQLNTTIKIFQSDWGGEFRSFSSFFNTHGIIHRLSCPHTSEQNGIVERKHRHIVELGLTLLAQSSLPLKFWPDAFSSAVYLINMMPTTVLQQRSPLEVLFKTKPDYSFLRVFGCQCFPHLRPYNSHKFDFISLPCTFVGYSSKHKGLSV